MPPRKSAALILAANHPPGVLALARFFQAAGVDVFVHVDRKLDIAPFQAGLVNEPGIRFLTTRTEVFWGGFSLVVATKLLIDAALAQGDYEFLMLLSDDTLPLINRAMMIDILASDTQFMRVLEDKATPFKARYDGFFMPDSAATQPRAVPALSREVTADAVARMNRLQALRQRGKRPLAAFHQGSNWWALNRASVDRIRHAWDADPWLRESFEFSLLPEEHYFHTILGESGTAPPPATFIHTEWDVEHPPRIFITIEEIVSRRDRGAPFIRKARLGSDDLDRYIGSLLT